MFPATGNVPLCCVLFLEQGGTLSRQVLCSSALAPGPNRGGIYPHPCLAGVLKLQDNVNLGLFPWPHEAAAVP